MEQACPICHLNEGVTVCASTTPGTKHVSCYRCGGYFITESLAGELEQPTTHFSGLERKGILPYLSAATRQALAPLTISHDNWEELARAHQTRKREKGVKLLKWIESNSHELGERFAFRVGLDYPIADARSPDEFIRLCHYQAERGLIVYEIQSPYNASSRDEISLTMAGWEAIEPREVSGGIPGRCFVAMWFDPAMEAAYELGIEPAIVADCKLPRPVRIDRKQHNNNIVMEILAEIRLSQFMIADFTGTRGGVYFEAGFARGLGREVIWTCREDHFKDVHFDTQQFSYIVWKDPADLRKKLRDRILGTVLVAPATASSSS